MIKANKPETAFHHGLLALIVPDQGEFMRAIE